MTLAELVNRVRAAFRRILQNMKAALLLLVTATPTTTAYRIIQSIRLTTMTTTAAPREPNAQE